MKVSRIFATALGFLVIFVFSTRSAHAYLDPGTGSFIFQILIASLLGVGFTVKTYWGKIKSFIGKFSNKSQETKPSQTKQ